jgi:hypothetical protein
MAFCLVPAGDDLSDSCKLEVTILIYKHVEAIGDWPT